MQKNVAGQRIGVQMVSASDGTAFTGSVTVYVTGDAGSQAIGSVGSGVCTHEGNGYHSYAPAQSETNFDLIAFTFTGSGAVPVTVQVYTAINPVTAVPTAAANATAVRSELATELGRIDVATSTRLAAGSYTAPPTAATVAGAVWDKATVDHTSTGSFGYVIGLLFGLIENVTGWRFTKKALEQAPGGSASGSGARTVTITVNDGTTALQNARVRLTNGAETYTGLTNASGVVVLNVDDADWVVSITKAGYSYSGTTLTVNGTETATYSMTLVALTPSSVDKVTGYWTVLDEEGSEASGVVVTVKARQASRGSAGALHDAATRTATSAANGLVQFPNMIPGWRYSVIANDEYVADFTVPADAVTSVELGSIVARLT